MEVRKEVVQRQLSFCIGAEQTIQRQTLKVLLTAFRLLGKVIGNIVSTVDC